ncbi:Na(+)/H(+) antiporter subunit D [Chloroflexota bacterium]
MTSLPPALIMIIGALVLLVAPRRLRSAAYLIFPVLALVLVMQLQEGAHLAYPFLSYELVPLRVDRLAIVFSYVFVIMSFIGGVYAFHVKDALQQIASMLYVAGALGVVFAGDLFTLLVFWELMAIASAGLIWAKRTERSRRAGLRYVLVHLFGGSVLMAGIMLHISQTGSIAFEVFDGSLASYFILFGFALNAAIPPLHAWLTDAYPESTVTGTVFLSAFTTKVAVYALARGFAGYDMLIWAGAVMVIYGTVYAIIENDMRRLLSYSIVSQIGYMVTAVGIGTALAINGAAVHAFSHILYKGLLFMGAGAVIYTTGHSKLSELGGLRKLMPWVFALYMIGALAISGFPLFSGFISKSMIISGADESHLLWVVVALYIASIGTFLHTGLKLPYLTWMGRDKGLKTERKVPAGMYIGMAMAAALCIVIGIFPNLLYNLLPYPVEYHPYTTGHVIEAMQMLVLTALGFWFIKNLMGDKATITLDTDWFYRRAQKPVYAVFVTFIANIYGTVEAAARYLAAKVVGFFGNPLGYSVLAVRRISGGDTGHHTRKREPAYFVPDRYRISVGVMVLIALIAFVVLSAWHLLN